MWLRSIMSTPLQFKPQNHDLLCSVAKQRHLTPLYFNTSEIDLVLKRTVSVRSVTALQILLKRYMCSDLTLNCAVSRLTALWNEALLSLTRDAAEKRACFCLRLCWSWNLIDAVTVKRFTWRFPSVCTVCEWQEVCCCLNSCSEC